jgi:DNA (cytosine-5)-methyltransferase 1
MSKSLTYLSLFTGIGGLDLGLDKAGMECVGQVERIPFCRTVLDEHWPEVPKHDDVRTAPAWWRSGARPVADLVAGGFPCQPFSKAGRRRGVADERWGWGLGKKLRYRQETFDRVRGLIRSTGLWRPPAESVEWLMGFPIGWSLPASLRSATPSSPTSASSSAA